MAGQAQRAWKVTWKVTQCQGPSEQSRGLKGEAREKETAVVLQDLLAGDAPREKWKGQGTTCGGRRGPQVEGSSPELKQGFATQVRRHPYGDY